MNKRHLVIVESPAKAETIGRFLGTDYIVDASYGHVRDLPSNAEERPESIKGKSWAELGVNVEEGFDPVYIVPADKESHVKRLRKELKKADKLLLATDEDREGESIGWHLTELLAPTIPVERIVFHEVTQEAIENALKSPRKVDRALVEAQESRRILDRLFGYSLSPVLWRKVQVGLSAGRVQSVGVRILVQRERDRAIFKSAEYWDIEAVLKSSTGKIPAVLRKIDTKRMPATRDFDSLTGELHSSGVEQLDEATVTKLVRKLDIAAPWTVSSIKATPATKKPAAPFTTSTLQQEANRKLGFTARRTMQIAQTLYEGIDLGDMREGLITYMRTDSVTLSSEAQSEAEKFITSSYGQNYTSGPREYKTKIRNAQEAHEAIRPTQISRQPESLKEALNRDQLRLYDLIWRRTIASQMKDAKLERTIIEIDVMHEEKRIVFEARGQQVKFPGFLDAYSESLDNTEDEEDGRILPSVSQGDVLQIEELQSKKHETQPPARFTEASLVRRLEEDGLGRPSTYAAILGTIQDRGYAFKHGNALVPTFVAFAVTELLERHFGDLVEPEFTATMEDALDEIASGESDSLTHLEAFYHGKADSLGLAGRIEAVVPDIPFPNLVLGNDPKTESSVVVRIGRFGPYIQRGEGGSGNTASLPDDLPPAELTLDRAIELIEVRQDGPRSLGHDPDTGIEVFLITGRFGPYVQLGPNPEQTPKTGERPKRASVPPDMELDNITIEDALLWLSLPRSLGLDPDNGNEVIAMSGRFGPYVKRDNDTRSLSDTDDVYTIDLTRALTLLAEPKSQGFRRRTSAKVLHELGSHPDSERSIRILDGRYGPYVTDGETNASLARGSAPSDLTLEDAIQLIAEKEASPKRRSRSLKKRASKTRKTSKKRASKTRKTSKKRASKTRKTSKK